MARFASPTHRGRSTKGHEPPTKGRVIALYGTTQAGTSTLIDILRRATKSRVAVVTITEDTTHTEIDDVIGEHRATGEADLVLLDGYPRTAADVRHLYDASWVYPQEGAIVRVRRGLFGPIDLAAAAIETATQEYGVGYYTVHNEEGEAGLNSAVLQLAQFLSINN